MAILLENVFVVVVDFDFVVVSVFAFAFAVVAAAAVCVAAAVAGKKTTVGCFVAVVFGVVADYYYWLQVKVEQLEQVLLVDYLQRTVIDAKYFSAVESVAASIENVATWRNCCYWWWG